MIGSSCSQLLHNYTHMAFENESRGINNAYILLCDHKFLVMFEIY